MNINQHSLRKRAGLVLPIVLAIPGSVTSLFGAADNLPLWANVVRDCSFGAAVGAAFHLGLVYALLLFLPPRRLWLRLLQGKADPRGEVATLLRHTVLNATRIEPLLRPYARMLSFDGLRHVSTWLIDLLRSRLSNYLERDETRQVVLALLQANETWFTSAAYTSSARDVDILTREILDAVNKSLWESRLVEELIAATEQEIISVESLLCDYKHPLLQKHLGTDLSLLAYLLERIDLPVLLAKLPVFQRLHALQCKIQEVVGLASAAFAFWGALVGGISAFAVGVLRALP